MTISNTGSPSKPKEIGHGNYVDTLGLEDEHCIRVAAGERFSKVVILGGKGNGSEAKEIGTATLHLIMEEGSQAEVIYLVLPGSRNTVEVCADLVGTGAELYLSGIYICSGEDRTDIMTVVRHRVEGCVSKQTFNGIAGGHSKVSFNGSIVVAPDAQNTEAYQTNRNILLSPTATIETKPHLEIYADDVKCSHGATIGKLNEDEQFYMRSRGIPETEAKVLQMISFVAPVLHDIEDEQLREELSDKVEAAIRENAL